MDSEKATNFSRRQFLLNAAKAAAGVTAGAVLGGCAPAATQTPGSSAPAAAPTAAQAAAAAATSAPAKPAGGPVNLRIHFRAGVEGDVIKERMEAFKQKFSNVNVALEGFSQNDYPEKIATLIAGNNIGDVMWGGTQTGEYYAYANAGVTRDISANIKQENFDTSVYIPQAYQKLPFKNGVFGLPFKAHPGASALFINPGLFKAAGAKVPDENSTWDDLLQAAKAIAKTDAQGRPALWGIVLNFGYFLWPNNLVKSLTGAEWVSKDGKKTQINSPESMEALQWIYDAVATHKVAPSPAMQNIGAQAFSNRDMFINQKTAMFHSGSFDKAMGATIKDQFEWDAIPLPKGKSGSRGAFIFCDVMCPTAKSKAPQESWEAVKWLTDQETGIRLGEGFGSGQSGTCGGRWDVYNSPRLVAPERGYKPHVHQVFIDLVKAGENYPTAANFRDIELQQNVGKNLLDPIFLGTQKPTKVYLDKIAAPLQEVLDKPPA